MSIFMNNNSNNNNVIYIGTAQGLQSKDHSRGPPTANLRARILDFRRFDSSRILISMSGILMSIGNFKEI